MSIIYDLTFILFSLFYLPVFLFKGKAHKGFCQRFGFSKNFKAILKSRNNIWIHAVSVGEVQAASSLLDFLREIFPLGRLVISTVTPAGNKLARNYALADELVIYFPLDLSFVVKKFVKYIKPIIFITTETEIWPNLFLALEKKNIPVILVNGRISERSFSGYKLIRPLLKSILRNVKLFCMQSPIDAERITNLGASKERVVVTGNMKFDVKFSGAKYQLTDLGLKNSDLLLIAGSTHKGEEEIIVNVYKNLLAEFPNLKLLLAPRHIERCAGIETKLKNNGIRYIRFSQAFKNVKDFEAILLDTIGNLNSLYALADVVFMGGSLIKKGGHNIIEPARLGKAVVFGQFMFNFRDIAQMFLERGAAVSINSKEELEGSLRKLLLDKNLRGKIGEAAKKIVEENSAAAEKTAVLIKQRAV